MGFEKEILIASNIARTDSKTATATAVEEMKT